MTDTSPPIVAPDSDPEDPLDTQEQVQQQPPAFGSQFYGFELPEDTGGSANRISLGTVSATDPDGGSVTYSIEGGNAAGLFEIDAASGELFYTGGGEDYETGSTSFELTVRASDGDQTTDTTATVSVTDVDEPVEVDPPVAQPDPARAAAEDLGDITELAVPLFPHGTLDGASDAVAWYRFTLSEAREVALGLRRQDADADLVVEDAAGTCSTAARTTVPLTSGYARRCWRGRITYAWRRRRRTTTAATGSTTAGCLSRRMRMPPTTCRQALSAVGSAPTLFRSRNRWTLSDRTAVSVSLMRSIPEIRPIEDRP